jgi:4-hydroxy-4-methyl-2-oxoglutarate aldolase
MSAAPLDSASSATVFETGLASMLGASIAPLDPASRTCGPAFTVLCAPGHNIWLHRAVYAARPGDVLVASVMGAVDFGYWGDILAHAALERGLAGLVIDGCVRDSREIVRAQFPVFARGLCVRGTGKDASVGGLGQVVHIGGAIIAPGDVIVGDIDGVVAVPADVVPAAERRARDRDEAEARVIDRLANGESTLAIYGWASA